MEDLTGADKDRDLWVLLQQAHNAIARARQNELRQVGITRPQASVLFVLQALKVQPTPAEISRWLFREPHTVSGLLDRMEQKGLIVKVKDLERKNLIRVVLTEEGKKAYQQSRDTKVIHKILSCLSQKDNASLIAYLRTVRDNATAELGMRYQLPYP